MSLIINNTDFDGVLLIEPKVFGDNRGFFLETYHKEKYFQEGVPHHFVQDNHSRSRKGTLRGMHYQLQHPQGKLLYVAQGEIFDVVVDIRLGSPTFGQWEGFELSSENKHQLFVPPGFAHGFCVVSETSDVFYKCTDLYHPEDEYGILWSDPAIGIKWPKLEGDMPYLSEKDQAYDVLKNIPESNLPRFSA